MWNSRNFWENYEKFWPIWGPDSQGPEAHILHTSKNSNNEHAKQDWYKSTGNVFDNIVENRDFDLFGGPKWPKILGLLGLSFIHILK